MEYTGLYVTFKTDLEDVEMAKDILISELAEVGFESFSETDDVLEAFIQSQSFDAENLPIGYLEDFASGWEIKNIPPQNWNQTWEENYPPVEVDDMVYVYAHFHPERPEVKHQIRITPKMSFGTGHHATTELVMRHMLQTDFSGKSVMDMGTGTGILAILAHQLGASQISASEIEDFALENCAENFENNGISQYHLYDARTQTGPYGKFDIIIANITRNTLLAVQDEIAASANWESTLIISGFYEQDAEDLIQAFALHGFKNPILKEKNQWVSIKFTKTT